jgi:hypothetical protein
LCLFGRFVTLPLLNVGVTSVLRDIRILDHLERQIATLPLQNGILLLNDWMTMHCERAEPMGLLPDGGGASPLALSDVAAYYWRLPAGVLSQITWLIGDGEVHQMMTALHTLAQCDNNDKLLMIKRLAQGKHSDRQGKLGESRERDTHGFLFTIGLLLSGYKHERSEKKL